ncbi:hypothetical protein ElyMa_002349900 [Elysia marginata]|uniref:Uncharacterized protein n=1 Tax=Elysia marginata TaxID=1093978 RepID=A0AAV4G9F6_9GAST|nr:hypothetical protein ElyMa_002349900 [Elysia marginata]
MGVKGKHQSYFPLARTLQNVILSSVEQKVSKSGHAQRVAGTRAVPLDVGLGSGCPNIHRSLAHEMSQCVLRMRFGRPVAGSRVPDASCWCSSPRSACRADGEVWGGVWKNWR